MAGSALVGQPPNTSDDYKVIVSIGRLMEFPPGMLDPSKGLPIPLKRPASDHYPTNFPNHAPAITAAMAIAISLIWIITGLRVGLRILRKDLRWGWDDIVIIPAAVRDLSQPSMKNRTLIRLW